MPARLHFAQRDRRGGCYGIAGIRGRINVQHVGCAVVVGPYRDVESGRIGVRRSCYGDHALLRGAREIAVVIGPADVAVRDSCAVGIDQRALGVETVARGADKQTCGLLQHQLEHIGVVGAIDLGGDRHVQLNRGLAGRGRTGSLVGCGLHGSGPGPFLVDQRPHLDVVFRAVGEFSDDVVGGTGAHTGSHVPLAVALVGGGAADPAHVVVHGVARGRLVRRRPGHCDRLL